VTDEAGFLSASTRSALDARLEAYERQSGHQVLVYVGRTLDGRPIEDFAVRAFEKWRVGRKGIDDGMVLFVFAEDRELRIEVGYGLEGQVPDLVASRIVNDVVVPRLREGERDGAVTAGVDAMLAAIEGKEPPAPTRGAVESQRPPPGLGIGGKIVVGLVVLLFLILFATNPQLALWLLINMLASSGRGHHRGGWSGGGGGGGFSGGGGRSGGGGASGRW
jgi:uncharacterized protein